MRQSRWFEMQVDIPGDCNGFFPEDMRDWVKNNNLLYAYTGKSSDGTGKITTHYKVFNRMRRYTALAFKLTFPECTIYVSKQHIYRR